MSEKKLAVIRIRGELHLPKEIKDTLFMLRLRKKNTCILLDQNSSNLGKIKKIKDYVTWGEIDPETEKMLIEKRGIKTKDGKLKPYFRLNPPRGGFERKGVKKPFSVGGALGNRKAKINELIKRMV